MQRRFKAAANDQIFILFAIVVTTLVTTLVMSQSCIITKATITLLKWFTLMQFPLTLVQI